MSLLIANKAMNTHVHHTNDGRLVTHSHPYNKTADNEFVKQHNHTSAFMVLLQHLDLLFFLAIVFFTVFNFHKTCRLENSIISIQSKTAIVQTP
ncbi:MAG: hypothetical protein R6U85_12890, partial [Salinivirgaceae bacterium]